MQQTFSKSVVMALLGLMTSANAHTWIEQMMVVAPNGTMVGQPGYARGNVLRSSSGFSDPTMVNLLPPDGRQINDILPTDLMCKTTQTSQTQTDGSPRLQAAPGSGIAMRYQENGHVTLPQNQPGKPDNRGTVYVYGTTQPSPSDSFLAIHRVWTADGKGGDGRGKLISTQNFDDGQCYQVNGGTISQQRQSQFPHQASSLTGADMWCQQDIQLPSDAQSGQPYTLYWVWDWPTLPGTSGFPDGKQEIYTTCMDIDVVSGGSAGVSDAASSFDFETGQDLNFAAISSEVANIANPTFVTGQTIAFGASATGPAAGTASASAAETTSTGTVPAFLSVHVSSDGGPGVETVPITSTVIPIGASFTPVPADTTAAQTTAAPQQTQASQAAPSESQASQSFGFGGHHSQNGGNGQQGSFTGFQTAAIVTPSAAAVTSAPATTDSPDIPFVNSSDSGLVQESQMATVIETDSVYETQFNTVWVTAFTKRNGTYPFFPTGPRTLALHSSASSTSQEVATSFVTVTVTGGYPMFTTLSPFNQTIYVTVTASPSPTPEASLAIPQAIPPVPETSPTSTTLPLLTVTVYPTASPTTFPIIPIITFSEGPVSVIHTDAPLTVVPVPSTPTGDAVISVTSNPISIVPITSTPNTSPIMIIPVTAQNTVSKHPANHKRSPLTSSSAEPLPTQAPEVATNAIPVTSSTTESAPCSTEASIYRLRARLPFLW